MNGRNERESLDPRVEEFRRLMRERRTVVDPGPYFVDRVIARLPQTDVPMLAWAARRVLPVTLALAAVLSVAILVSGSSASRQPSGASSAAVPHASDPLDFLLENRQAAQ